MKIKTPSNIRDFKSYITSLLETKLCVSPSVSLIEAEILLEHAVDHIKSKTDIYSKGDTELSDVETEILNSLLEERLLGKPIAYLINEKEFYGRKFFVDDRVLIPRPETEHLIEEALDFAKYYKNIFIIDIGTGSGIIPITLNLEIQSLGIRPILSIASDISYPALEVAKINIDTLINSKDRILLLNADLAEPYALSNLLLLNMNNELIEKTAIIITANLPYIDILDPETDYFVKVYEPSMALFSPDRGLYSIKTLVDNLLKESKKFIEKPIVFKLLLEIGANQADELISYIKNLGCKNIKLIKDYAGLDRVISVEF